MLQIFFLFVQTFSHKTENWNKDDLSNVWFYNITNSNWNVEQVERWITLSDLNLNFAWNHEFW